MIDIVRRFREYPERSVTCRLPIRSDRHLVGSRLKDLRRQKKFTCDILDTRDSPQDSPDDLESRILLRPFAIVHCDTLLPAFELDPMRMGYAGRNSETESAKGANPRALGHRRLLFTEVAVLKFSCTRCERESTFAGERLRSTFACSVSAEPVRPPCFA